MPAVVLQDTEPRLSPQARIVLELEPGLAAVVQADDADHVRAHRAVRVVALALRLEMQGLAVPGRILDLCALVLVAASQLLDALVLGEVRETLDPLEPAPPEPLLQVARVHAGGLGQHCGHRPLVADAVGEHADGLGRRAQRQLLEPAVEDAPPPRQDVHFGHLLPLGAVCQLVLPQ